MSVLSLGVTEDDSQGDAWCISDLCLDAVFSLLSNLGAIVCDLFCTYFLR